MPAAAAERHELGVTVRITLPESILTEYEAQAAAKEIPVEDLISARLATCVDYTASKPLYFDDHDRQQLESVLGKNIKHTKDALAQVRQATAVRIEKLTINLKLSLLQKLKTRCLGIPWEKFLEERITHALEQYVGMR